MHFVRASLMVLLLTPAACYWGDDADDSYDCGSYDCSYSSGSYSGYQPATPEVTSCTNDYDCVYGQHCHQPATCTEYVCDSTGQCTCSAPGTCTASECASDLDCREAAVCTLSANGTGTCQIPCPVGATCTQPSGLARCADDTDCRVDQGATCHLGWCTAPAIAADAGVDASAVDAGTVDASCGG